MHANKLEGKRILMLGAMFFNYGQTIRAQLEKQGALVDHYDERPDLGVVTRIALRFRLGIVKPKVKKYFQALIEQNRDKDYDYVFVVKGEAVSPEIIKLLRRAYPKAKFILYLWDSVENIPDCEKKIPCYDRVLSFDTEDAKNYGLLFRPLFFAKDFEAKYTENREYLYDVSFIGTAHSIRPRIVRQLQQQCLQQDRKMYAYLFLPHPVVFFYNKLLNRDYKQVKKVDIHFKPLEFSQVSQIYDQTRCVLDVEHNRQRGLTMRTIEMLGMQKKIITTNTQVADYDFYDARNICIIDRKEPRISREFWEAPYVPIPQAVLQRYSLESFLQEIFDTEGECS